ncbi:MAG TPA: GNAT family N-acetyltransferase [Desulfobacteraceae bacterium]|nr:GNAT family N-acetyltransferase [Desulfobacteraceae bacterium]
MSVTIKDATRKDIDRMLPLLEQLFSIEADFTFDPEVQRRGLSLMLDGCGKHRAVKIAYTEEGRLVGMCTAQTRISTAQGKISAVVEDLVVDRDFRGLKIGQALLAAIHDWASARGITGLSLLADKHNTQGLAFYQSQDWETTDLVCLTKKI